MQTAEGPRKVHYNAFGPYRLARTIGQGGCFFLTLEFGKVKLAYHIRTNKEIAIKLIKKENIQNPTRREKLIREIDILKSINHHHVVKLYEVIETEGYIGMVMEFASGGELFEHILARTYLKDSEAANFFAQLLVGVSFLHENGIVHRDLKLENLLLDKNKKIIITDFGFANRFSRGGGKEYLSTSCGSPCYAAPELVVNDCYVGESADIWSCGVILYAMLCGYLPFDDEMANAADSVNKLYQYILEAKLEYPPYVRSIPKHLISIILVTDPKQRATMQQMKQHPFLQDYRHMFADLKAVKPKTSDPSIVPDVVNNSNVPPLIAPIPVKTPFFGIPATTPVNSSLETVVENSDPVKLQEPSPTNSISGDKFVHVPTVEVQVESTIVQSPQSRENLLVPEPVKQESTAEIAKSSKEQLKENVEVAPTPTKSQSDEKLNRPQSKSKRISRTLSREDMPRSSDLLKNNLIASQIKEEKSQEKLDKLRQSLEKLEKLKIPEIPQEPELSKDHVRAKSVDQPRSYGARGETQSFKEFVRSTYGRKSTNNTRAHLKSDMGVAFPFTTTELEKMKYHSGPIDHRALSSLSASELLVKIVKVLNEMGFEVLYTDDPYKLKAVRQDDEHVDDNSNSESDFAESFTVGRSIASTAPSTRPIHGNSKVPHKKSKIGNVLASLPFSLVQSIKNVGQFGLQYNRGYDGKPLPESSASHVPSEKKLKFYVMVHKIKNLDGLLTVDLKRYRGDIWEFKKLYHEIITNLNLKVENK
ncbi:hypothetical protein HDV04_003639 [Boothiomyces sp. JEL0838]|nr:hypothetical protein HDV04_003639 [Boothiomyces sp. JEL0838]